MAVKCTQGSRGWGFAQWRTANGERRTANGGRQTVGGEAQSKTGTSRTDQNVPVLYLTLVPLSLWAFAPFSAATSHRPLS